MKRITLATTAAMDSVEAMWRATLGQDTVNHAVTVDRFSLTSLRVVNEDGYELLFSVNRGLSFDSVPRHAS